MHVFRELIRRTLKPLRKTYFKGTQFYCSLCDHHFRQFMPSGTPPRNNVLCPACKSLERHRLLWSTLNLLWEKEQLTASGKLLHVAPEPAIGEKLSKQYAYLSVDLSKGTAMREMDITNMPLDDNEFDVIICNHVLEHIPDDIKALSELFRVMRHGGWGCIQVPMKGDITDEDLTIMDAKARTERYGQPDHVRQYGRDFLEKLTNAGFVVDIYLKQDMFNTEFLRQLAVDTENEVVIVRKSI